VRRRRATTSEVPNYTRTHWALSGARRALPASAVHGFGGLLGVELPDEGLQQPLEVRNLQLGAPAPGRLHRLLRAGGPRRHGRGGRGGARGALRRMAHRPRGLAARAFARRRRGRRRRRQRFRFGTLCHPRRAGRRVAGGELCRRRRRRRRGGAGGSRGPGGGCSFAHSAWATAAPRPG